ncbi:MAG: acyltransferase [Candidatus Thiodiazotropha sp.]
MPTTVRAISRKVSAMISANFLDIFQQSPNRYPALDGLRAIAMLLVLFFHCFYLNYASIEPTQRSQLLLDMSPWLNWVWQGDKGVDLFFVLSGFLISMLLLKEHRNSGRVDIRKFYIRRIARILPAYLVLLLIAWFVDMPNREWIWGNLLFVSNLQPPATLFIPWSWSITVEVQFYILFPLLLLPLITRSKKPLLVMTVVVISCMLLRQFILALYDNLNNMPFYEILFDTKKLAAWWDTLYIHLYTRAGPIVLGITAGVIHNFHGKKLDRFANSYNKSYLFIIGFALAIFLTILTLPVHMVQMDYLSHIGHLGNLLFLGQHRNLFSLSVAILLLIAIHPASSTISFSTILRSKMLTPIAKVSYSAYLFHIFIIWIVFKYLRDNWQEGIGEPSWFAVGIILVMVVTFAVSTLSYIFIEKPFNDMAARKH